MPLSEGSLILKMEEKLGSTRSSAERAWDIENEMEDLKVRIAPNRVLLQMTEGTRATYDKRRKSQEVANARRRGKKFSPHPGFVAEPDFSPLPYIFKSTFEEAIDTHNDLEKAQRMMQLQGVEPKEVKKQTDEWVNNVRYSKDAKWETIRSKMLKEHEDTLLRRMDEFFEKPEDSKFFPDFKRLIIPKFEGDPRFEGMSKREKESAALQAFQSGGLLAGGGFAAEALTGVRATKETGRAQEQFNEAVLAPIIGAVESLSFDNIKAPDFGRSTGLAKTGRALGALGGFLLGPLPAGSKLASKLPFIGRLPTTAVGTLFHQSMKTAVELGMASTLMTPDKGFFAIGARLEAGATALPSGLALGAVGQIPGVPSFGRLKATPRIIAASLTLGVPASMRELPLEDQVFQYGLGAVLGRKGIGPKQRASINREILRGRKFWADGIKRAEVEQASLQKKYEGYGGTAESREASVLRALNMGGAIRVELKGGKFAAVKRSSLNKSISGMLQTIRNDPFYPMFDRPTKNIVEYFTRLERGKYKADMGKMSKLNVRELGGAFELLQGAQPNLDVAGQYGLVIKAGLPEGTKGRQFGVLAPAGRPFYKRLERLGFKPMWAGEGVNAMAWSGASEMAYDNQQYAKMSNQLKKVAGLSKKVRVDLASHLDRGRVPLANDMAEVRDLKTGEVMVKATRRALQKQIHGEAGKAGIFKEVKGKKVKVDPLKKNAAYRALARKSTGKSSTKDMSIRNMQDFLMAIRENPNSKWKTPDDVITRAELVRRHGEKVGKTADVIDKWWRSSLDARNRLRTLRGQEPIEPLTNYFTHIFDIDASQGMQDFLKLPQHIQDIMVGTQREKFFAFGQARKGKQGYVMDIWKVMDAYQISNSKMLLDKPIARMGDLIDFFKSMHAIETGKISKTVSTKRIKKLTGSGTFGIIDYPTLIDQLGKLQREYSGAQYAADTNIESRVGWVNKYLPKRLQVRSAYSASNLLTELTYGTNLAFRPTSAIRNLGQQSLLIGKLGVRGTIKGSVTGLSVLLGINKSPEMLRVAENSNMIKGRALQFSPESESLSGTGAIKRIIRFGLQGFSGVDRWNVYAGVYGGYFDAKSRRLSFAESVRFGDQVAAQTQFPYGKMGRMPISTFWGKSRLIGRPFSIFTSWPVHYAEYTNSIWREDPKRAAEYTTIGALVTLAGIYGGFKGSQYVGFSAIPSLYKLGTGQLPVAGIAQRPIKGGLWRDIEKFVESDKDLKAYMDLMFYLQDERNLEEDIEKLQRAIGQ